MFKLIWCENIYDWRINVFDISYVKVCWVELLKVTVLNEVSSCSHMFFEIRSRVNLIAYMMVKNNIHDIMLNKFVEKNKVFPKQLKILFWNLLYLNEIHEKLHPFSQHSLVHQEFIKLFFWKLIIFNRPKKNVFLIDTILLLEVINLHLTCFLYSFDTVLNRCKVHFYVFVWVLTTLVWSFLVWG